ncbi:hypothetical protein QYQ99_26775 [Comamonas testosteroni]|uniref:hypothetical protein n=1 Tax=Comamonas testosteroni TaxID=285 RepID=UPI00265EA75D|nr:hypothetical protein [Comamonas testosteroni]WKL15873.1 hypothetical protein QYQ99_26775 [Comamonas testosteroni]
MSKSITSLPAVLAFSLCSLSVQAQPHGPAPQHPPMPSRPGLAGQYVVEGQVQRMLINPYGEVDGLRLKDGTIVKFPPHMAEALLAAVKVGDAVRVIGRAQTRGTVQAEAIVQTASGRTVYEQPPVVGEGRVLPPHLRAQRLQTQQVEGRIDTVLTGPRGEANGVILSDGSIVRFPPESLRISVQPGAAFAASGMGTRNEFGTSLEAVSMGTTLAALQPLYDRAQ